MDICRMMAIDSSTNKTGISIWDNGNLIDYLLIDCSYDKLMDSRFSKMVMRLINEMRGWKPYIIYMEETVVNRNVQVQRFLTRLQGVVYGYCILNDCEFNTIRPTEWRSLVHMDFGGKKRDTLKQLAIEMVKQNYNIETTDDVAEAILIGQAAINKYKKAGD